MITINGTLRVAVMYRSGMIVDRTVCGRITTAIVAIIGSHR